MSNQAAALLQRLTSDDPGRPRITWYADPASPLAGERVELSGKTLTNWVAKAANLLTEELDAAWAEPPLRVVLDLPELHWRALVWHLAAAYAGARVQRSDIRPVESPAQSPVVPVRSGDGPPDVLVTCTTALPPPGAPTQALVLVTLPALARRAEHPRAFDGALAGALLIDEAAELATYPDQLPPPGSGGRGSDDSGAATDEPAPPAPRLEPGGRWLLRPGEHRREDVLAAWAAGGSVVVAEGALDDEAIARLLTTERAEPFPRGR